MLKHTILVATLTMVGSIMAHSQTPKVAPKTNREIIMALYEAFGRKDMTTIMALMDPAMTVSQTDQLPWGGTFNGYDGFQRFFGGLIKGLDNRLTVEEYLEAGDQIIAIGRTSGHIRANGNPFDLRAVHIWTLRDGRAIRFEPYINAPAMLDALKTK